MDGRYIRIRLGRFRLERGSDPRPLDKWASAKVTLDMPILIQRCVSSGVGKIKCPEADSEKVPYHGFLPLLQRDIICYSLFSFLDNKAHMYRNRATTKNLVLEEKILALKRVNYWE